MSKAICSYIVKARAAYLNEQSGDIEYIATEKKFFDKNPIEAREEAFNYRNLIISGMIDTGTDYDLDDLGWDKYSPRRFLLTIGLVGANTFSANFSFILVQYI